MAGLIDFLTGNNSGGNSFTLSPLEMGLLGAAAGAGQYAGASRLPVTTGQVIGGASGGFGQGYGAGLQAQAQALSNQLNAMNVAGFRRYLYGNGIDSAVNGTSGKGQTVAFPGVDGPQVIKGVVGARDSSGVSAPTGGLLANGAAPAVPAGGTAPPVAPMATAPAVPGPAQPPPLFGVPQLGAQIKQLMSFPAGMNIAGKLIGLLPKVPPGAYLATDGSIQSVPGMTGTLFQQGQATKAGEGAGTLQYAGPIAAAQAAGEYPYKLGLETNKPYALRGPGSSLIQGGRVVAQNPYSVTGVDAAGHPFQTFVAPPILGSNGPLNVPAGAGGLPPATPSATDALRAVQAKYGSVPTAAATAGGPGSTPLAFRGALPPPSAATGATRPSSGPNITYNAQGFPVVQTGLSPLEAESQKSRGEALEKYSENLDTAATNAVNQNYLINRMRAESQTWTPNAFANIAGDLRNYMNGFATSVFGDSAVKQPALGDWQAFNKNSMELVRQAVRATSSRAAIQEFQMIQKALPNAEMSRGGIDQIFDQYGAANDFMVGKQAMAQAWRDGKVQGSPGNGTLAGFDTFWNTHTTPGVFLLHRLENNLPAAQQMFANLQKTSEGRATLAGLRARYQWSLQNGVFGAAQ